MASVRAASSALVGVRQQMMKSRNIYSSALRSPTASFGRWTGAQRHDCRVSIRQFATDGKPTKDAAKDAIEKTTEAAKTPFQRWLDKFLGHKEIPPRWTPKWYGEMILLSTVFAITGSSTMYLVRPAVSKGLGLQGSFKDGPWSYRICSLVIMTPIYASLLLVVGTVFGRHFYFRHFSVKMWSRFGIPPEMIDANYHQTVKKFRKW